MSAVFVYILKYIYAVCWYNICALMRQTWTPCFVSFHSTKHKNCPFNISSLFIYYSTVKIKIKKFKVQVSRLLLLWALIISSAGCCGKDDHFACHQAIYTSYIQLSKRPFAFEKSFLYHPQRAWACATCAHLLCWRSAFVERRESRMPH